MSGAPLLSEADVRLEVERLFRRKHRSSLVALFGRGEAGDFEFNGARWAIVPTACELDLRAKLPAPGRAPEAKVYLVDWAEDSLPLDISCRLAGGRLYHVARDARLAALLGARQVEPGLASTALARFVLAGRVEGLRKITGLLLSKDELWKRVLAAHFGIPEDAVVDGPSFLRWARCSEGGPAFAKGCENDDLLRALRQELLAWLEARLGAVGALGLRAWELGLANGALQALLLLSAAEQNEDAYLRGLVNGQLEGVAPGLSEAVRGVFVGGGAETLLDALLEPGSQEDRRLLDEAEGHARKGGAAAIVATSAWLPGGHAAREAAAAAALQRFLDSPRGEALAALLGAFEHLGAHRLDGALRGPEHVEARKMAMRLATWLLGRRQGPQLAAHGPRWQPAALLAQRYAAEGGFLDWARQRLRGMQGGGEALAAAVRRLGEEVDRIAGADDEAFAKAYVAWLEAGKPSGEVLPIEHVTKRVVAEFLKGGSHRRLLLVLMDGMSQAAAVQVLQRLHHERRWSPIAWRTPGWSGPLRIPPVLAAAPTLTEVSRAALFAGVADPRFGDQGTDKDGARWAANPHLRDWAGDAPFPIYFRRDIQAGNELIDEVKEAVAGEQRVVAVVVNAVDENLKGSFQVVNDYSKVGIRPLETLLNAADGAERAVLLVADHGHVYGDPMKVAGGRLAGGRTGGARWRALAEGEEALEGELRLPKGTWKPRGSAGVATLWDTSLSNRVPEFGEHGGISLAEVVAPAFLIGPEWLDCVAGDDVDLSSRPLEEPSWWLLELPRPAVVASAPDGPEAQLSLLPAEASVPAPASAPAEPTLVARLRASKLFAQQVAGVSEAEVEHVLLWLGVLAEAGGSMAAADFARRCGARPHHVGGLVARMGILNADGFAIVEHDIAGRRVLLHRARLAAQFGVPE